MNKTNFFLIIFFFINLHADDTKTFKVANELFYKKKYQEALEKYNAISNKNSKCLFNIGNCYYNLKDFKQAYLHWKKALKIGSISNIKDIEKNILHVEEKLCINCSDNLFSKINNFIVKYVHLMPLLYLQIIFIVFWYLFFILVQFIFRKKNLVLFFIMITNFVLLGCLSVKYNFGIKNPGIISQNKVDVYAGPGNDFHTIGYLMFPEEVNIVQRTGDWIKISNNQLKGWVKQNKVFVL